MMHKKSLFFGLMLLLGAIAGKSLFELEAKIKRVVTFTPSVIERKYASEWKPSEETAYFFELKGPADYPFSVKKKDYDSASLGDPVCVKESRVSKDELASTMKLIFGGCRE
mgnify:CR=1 FL=1